MKNKKSFAVLLLIVVLITFCKYNAFKERSVNEKPYPIEYDVFGYYLFLPATFIYDDLGLEDRTWQDHIRSKYAPSSTSYQVVAGEGNKQVDIYNVGYAFINAPGFLIAHALADSLGFEADGFSVPYQYSLEITAFLITLLGLVLVRKIALHFFSDTITAVLLVIVLIGSNYFFQVTYCGVMPHNTLFTLNCCIIWLTIKWHEQQKLKYLLLLSFFLGLASICRPVELIWILVPLLWGVSDKASFTLKWELLKKHFKQILISLFVLTGIIFIQFAYYKYASGSFITLNLHSETFSFLDPYTFKFLFSYKKGWLLYTPIMLFGIIGFYFLFKKNKTIFLPLLSFFVINVYVVSSWECWWYGASFGQRPMVETYAMMILPMGYFLSWMKEKPVFLRIVFHSIFAILLVFNLFQTWQFLQNIIDTDRMTEKYYWEVFGKTSIDPAVRDFLSVDHNQSVFSDYNHYADKYIQTLPFVLDFEQSTDKNTIDTTAANGKKSYMLTKEHAFSSSYEQKFSDITDNSYVWLRASVWVYLTVPYTESNSCLVILTESGKNLTKYRTTDYQNFNIPLHTWTKIYLDYITPDIRHADDKVKVYFWNMGDKPVLIDNFKVEVFDPKIDYDVD